MPAPVFNLATSGTDSKLTSKQTLDNEVNRVVELLDAADQETRDLLSGLGSGIKVKGAFDASSGSFPSGASAGDIYRVSVAGTVGGQSFLVNDTLTSLKDSPSTSVYAANWLRGDNSDILLSAKVQFFDTLSELTVSSNITVGQEADIIGTRYTVVAANTYLDDPTVTNLTGISGQAVPKEPFPWLPSVNGRGTPSVSLSKVRTGGKIAVSDYGRVGEGPNAGKLYRAGDVLTAVASTTPLLVVLSGQSNAQGAAQDGLGGTYRINPKVKVWDNSTGTFKVADMENEAYFTTTGNPIGNGNQNIGVSFAHRLQEQTGRDIYVIVAAQGGQPISEWVGSGTSSTIYAGMETVIQAQLTALGKTGIDFFLWSQGENDATRATGEYRRDLGTFIEQLRAEPWFPADTPFIAAQACPSWSQTTRRDYMNEELSTITKRSDPYLFVASSTGLTGDGDVAFENIHYGNASIEALGYTRFWNALWYASVDIPVAVAPTATKVFTKDDTTYASADELYAQFVKQTDLQVTRPSTQFVKIATPQSYMELASAGGDGIINFKAKLLRPNTTGTTDLGGVTLAFRRLYVSTSIVQPLNADLAILVNGVNTWDFRANGSVRQRGSEFAFFDERAAGFNVINFTASDGSLRAQEVVTYSGLGASIRAGIANSSGAVNTYLRVDTDGNFRLPLAPSFTTTEAPNAVIQTDGSVKTSTTAGVATSIAAAPVRTGQFAVVGGVGYMAVGTSSAADWKQITV